MSVVKLIRNGGKIVGGVEDIKDLVVSVMDENISLKTLVEKQGAIIVSIKDELGVVGRKLDAIQDEVTYSKKTTDEIKHTKFIGQATKLLPAAVEKAKQLSGKEVRKLIHKAALTHESGRRKGYTKIYVKLEEITGVNLYDKGKTRLKKSDGVDGWAKDPSYINTILKEGLQTEAAVLCMQIIAEK